MNDTKLMMSDRVAASTKLPSRAGTAARTVPRPSKSSKPLPKKISASIHNLPGANFIMTSEILRTNVCRICATYYESGPNLVPLYVSFAGTKLSEMINVFLPIKVQEQDGLPEYACRTCTNKLMAWRDMRDSVAESARILLLQAKILAGIPIVEPRRNVRCWLTDTVRSVLAAYLLNVGSMELVCHKCDLKTSSDTFVKHLESNHGDVRDHDTVEAFVRDYVTFEETLISESDGDDASIVSVASTEAPDVIPQRLDCPLCASAFSSRFRLVQHLTKHPEANLGDGISCCGDTRNENELITHLNREHKDPNRIQCKSCDHIAVDKPTSTTHIAHCHTESKSDVITNIQLGSPGPDETNQKRIPAVCPNCNRTFSNKYNMLNHMKSHAKDAKTSKFVCECGKSYSTRGNLVAHIRIAHTEELPHRCSDCGEGFPTRSTRDIHSRLHSGARPFSCAFCPLSFRSKNSQDKHQETHVPPQHECELCGKKFRRKAHLRYHVGTHRGRPT